MMPTLWKELRVRMRGLGTPLVLTAYVTLLAALVLAVIGYLESQQLTANYGQAALSLFGFLSGLQLLLLAFIAPALTAGAIAGERERETLDILLATGLPAWGILLGKLAAALALVLLLMASAVPLFMVIFVFGGVSYVLLWHVLLLQFAVALGLGGAGLAVSSLLDRPGAATAVAVGLTVLVLFGTLGLGLLQTARAASQMNRVAVTVPVMPIGPKGVITLPAPAPPLKVPQPKPPPAPWALYVSPLVALVSVVLGRDAVPTFGVSATTYWLICVITYLGVAVACFGLSWALLERRGPPAMRLRKGG